MDVTKEIAQELLTMLRDTKGFVLEQAPDVAQQIVKWGFWSSLIGLLIMLSFAAWGGYLFALVRGNLRKRQDIDRCFDKEPFHCGMACSAMGAAGFFILGLLFFAPTLIQVIVAPKLYLLEQLGRLAG